MKKFFGYFKAVISIALLTALVWIMKDNLKVIGNILSNAKRPLIFLAIILFTIGIIIQSYRLKFLLDTQRIHLKIKDVIYLTFIGQFFNNFMPTTIGGDIVKAYYLSSGTEKKLETFTSVAMDRILGVVTIMWIAAIAIVIGYKQLTDKTAAAAIAVIFIAGALFMTVIFNKKITRRFLFLKKFFKKFAFEEKLHRLQEAMNKYTHRKALIFKTLTVSFIAQLILFFVTYLLAVSLFTEVSFVFMLLILPIIATMSMLPSLNGLGIRESGFVYFLSGAMGREKAFALSLLYLGAMIFASIIGGIIFLFKKEFEHISLPASKP